MSYDKAENSEQLELMVDQLHSYLRTDLRYGDGFLPSPFMIEFTGSPDSGKTTCIEELAPQYPQVALIDTTNLNETEMVTRVATSTLERLITKARERRNHS